MEVALSKVTDLIKSPSVHHCVAFAKHSFIETFSSFNFIYTTLSLFKEKKIPLKKKFPKVLYYVHMEHICHTHTLLLYILPTWLLILSPRPILLLPIC